MSHRREDFAAAVASSRLDVLAAGVPEAAGAPGRGRCEQMQIEQTWAMALPLGAKHEFLQNKANLMNKHE
jgi:hypothetical protein